MCGVRRMNGYKNDTIIFKALCDEKRLSILELLKGGEKCACVPVSYTHLDVYKRQAMTSSFSFWDRKEIT